MGGRAKAVYGTEGLCRRIPCRKDIGVAKNYLDEDELNILNNLVSGYFDFAEISALEHRPMYMADYVSQLDAILSSGGRKVLADAESVSHTQALHEARGEYRKYQEATLSPVEQAYLETIKQTGEAVKQELKKKSHPPLTHNLTQNRKKTVEATEQRGPESIWFWGEEFSKVLEIAGNVQSQTLERSS